MVYAKNRKAIARRKVDQMTSDRRHLQEVKRQLLQKEKKRKMGLIKTLPDGTEVEMPFPELKLKGRF